MTFVDRTCGWAIGFDAIFATGDGGDTWVRQSSPSMQYLRIAFVDTRHGWAVGNGASVLRTDDGGATWTEIPTGVWGSWSSLIFVDAMHGWLGDGFNGKLIATDDGGRTWTPRQRPPARAWGLSFADDQHGWAAGIEDTTTKGALAATADGGATWTEVPLPFSDSVGAVALPDPLHGWIVGAQEGVPGPDGQPTPVLHITSDGGKTWASQDIGHPQRVYTMTFVDAGHGWIGGDEVLVGHP